MKADLERSESTFSGTLLEVQPVEAIFSLLYTKATHGCLRSFQQLLFRFTSSYLSKLEDLSEFFQTRAERWTGNH